MKKQDLRDHIENLTHELEVLQARERVRGNVKAGLLEAALSNAVPGTDVTIITEAGHLMRATVIDVRRDHSLIDTGAGFAQGPREVSILLAPRPGMAHDE